MSILAKIIKTKIVKSDRLVQLNVTLTRLDAAILFPESVFLNRTA